MKNVTFAKRVYIYIFTVCTLCMVSQQCWADLEKLIIIPLPETVKNVDQPIISLNGLWKFTRTPPEKFWLKDTETKGWHDIQVPGEPFMQGFPIRQDVEYPFNRTFNIPSDFAGKKILIRFDGVYSYARVWVNGIYIKDHQGGFTTWDVDITDHVEPGKPAVLTVGVTDRSDDIARGSFYAKHNIGGILRDVRLLAVPKTHVQHLHINTDLDKNYKNAILNISAGLHFDPNNFRARLHLTLEDQQGQEIPLEQGNIDVVSSTPNENISIPISEPRLWTAETPYLYTLKSRLVIEGETVETLSTRIGFREVEVRGEQLLINGHPVKLRGVNRHSIDPLLGRVETPELALKDVKLFKSGNVNFVRASHYPPTQAFLNYADEYGLYVEDETAITWWGEIPKESALYTADFMNGLAEMIERDRNHPSIIMWSIGNESFWDPNFDKEYKYAKAIDPSRPIIWSYTEVRGPEEDISKTDIFSQHYPAFTDEVPRKGKPILLDEYAHVVSYDIPTLQRDPNIRNFWGESIAGYWSKILKNPHALGGAIWGGIDESFYSPQGMSGYGDWGVIDGWRRPKPEFWLMKKAYSPIRISAKNSLEIHQGKPLAVNVWNTFDHTNLGNLNIAWRIGSEKGVLSSVDIPPWEEGILHIPAHQGAYGELLNLQFTKDDILIDEFNLMIGKTMQKAAPQPTATPPKLIQKSSELIVTGPDFAIHFDNRSGKITKGIYQGKTLITGGPDLVLTPVLLEGWSLSNLEANIEENYALIRIAGQYGELDINYILQISSNGIITTNYTFSPPPEIIQEVGIRYDLVDAIDRLSWNRNAQWTAYPADHIGRPNGLAQRFNPAPPKKYRERPNWPWAMDTKNAVLYGMHDKGRATNDFRSMKTQIYYASIYEDTTGLGVAIDASGDQAVRMGDMIADCMVDDRVPRIQYHGNWEKEKDGMSCYETATVSKTAGDYAEFTFFGDSVKWIAPVSFKNGMADVYLDDVLVAKDVDLFTEQNIIGQRIVFEKIDLPRTQHTIKVFVTGKKHKQSLDTRVVIDGFFFADGQHPPSASSLNIMNDWGYDPLWGNYKKVLDLSNQPYSGSVTMRFTNTLP